MRRGVHEKTGKWLESWPHCVQCINTILRTRLHGRPWARDFGARVKDLQDQNAAARFLIEFTREIMDALDDGEEPGFALTSFELVEGGRDGRFVFIMIGTYYPRGHEGDFSLSETRRAELPANDNIQGLELVAA